MSCSKPTAKPGETLDRICGVLEVFQAKKGYRFGLESLLLAWFVRPGVERLLDLGCGSGIIPLVLTRFERVQQAVGVELQPGLADRARRSVKHNQLSDRVEILEADIRSLEEILPAGTFDVVTANPPFRPAKTGHVSQNREKARAKHEILCSLADVVPQAARLLKPRGRFDVVFPPERLPELFRLCEKNRLRPARLRMVHGRTELLAKNCLIEAIKSGRNILKVEHPLIVYDSSGEYTQEVKAILYPSG